MRLVGELGDECLEVPRNTADGGVLRGQLGFHARHLVGKARRQGLNRIVFGFLPQALVAREDGVNGLKQFRLDGRGQVEMFAHPRLQLGPRLRMVRGGADLVGLHFSSRPKPAQPF